MALIKCEKCGGEVSDQAQPCPHCGCPVVVVPAQPLRADSEAPSATPPQPPPPVEDSSSQEIPAPVPAVKRVIIDAHDKARASLRQLWRWLRAVVNDPLVSLLWKSALILLFGYFLSGKAAGTVEASGCLGWVIGWLTADAFSRGISGPRECVFVVVSLVSIGMCWLPATPTNEQDQITRDQIDRDQTAPPYYLRESEPHDTGRSVNFGLILGVFAGRYHTLYQRERGRNANAEKKGGRA